MVSDSAHASFYTVKLFFDWTGALSKNMFIIDCLFMQIPTHKKHELVVQVIVHNFLITSY